MFQVKRLGQQNEKIGNTGFDLRLFFRGKSVRLELRRIRVLRRHQSQTENYVSDLLRPADTRPFDPAEGNRTHSRRRRKRLFCRRTGNAQTQYQIWIKDVYVKTLDQNHACLLPSEIEIKFGYNDPLIYVSKEIDRNSCKFSQVIRHEQVHQRINILTLEYFLPLIDETIRNAISEVRAIKVSGTGDAEIRAGIDRLYEYYTARLKPIIDEFHKARENEQRKLDNIVNYTLESELCREFDRERPDKRL